jgi:transcriptional regulator with XRE-family HTH domain
MAAAKRKATELDATVGRNVRRIREDLGGTQDQLVQALRASGWALSAATVIALERGERKITIEEGLLLADVLNVAFAELLADDPDHPHVRLGSLYPDYGGNLSARLTEARFPASPTAEETTWTEVQQRRRTIGFGATDAAALESFASGSLGYTPDDEAAREAERYAAERLGIPPDEVVERSHARWGRTLSDERDARAEERVAEAMRHFRDDLVRAEERAAKPWARAEDKRELADARTRVNEGTPRQRAAVRSHVTRELLDELEVDPQEER